MFKGESIRPLSKKDIAAALVAGAVAVGAASPASAETKLTDTQMDNITAAGVHAYDSQRWGGTIWVDNHTRRTMEGSGDTLTKIHSNNGIK